MTPEPKKLPGSPAPADLPRDNFPGVSREGGGESFERAANGPASVHVSCHNPKNLLHSPSGHIWPGNLITDPPPWKLFPATATTLSDNVSRGGNLMGHFISDLHVKHVRHTVQTQKYTLYVLCFVHFGRWLNKHTCTCITSLWKQNHVVERVTGGKEGIMPGLWCLAAAPSSGCGPCWT